LLRPPSCLPKLSIGDPGTPELGAFPAVVVAVDPPG